MSIENQNGSEGIIRLQKFLASCSLGSRRECEDFIKQGRVEVDGKTVSDLGRKVDPRSQKVKLDGSIVRPISFEKVVLALNKPKNVLSAMSDKSSRTTLSDLLPYKSKAKLFHIGRLDYDSEGLILMTNDGQLANKLSHPRYGIKKTYMVFLRKPIDPKIASALVKRGVLLEDGWQNFDKLKIIRRGSHKSTVLVTLHSGKNRIVRRVFAATGNVVERLVRVKFGPITLGRLRPGECRKLGMAQIEELQREVGI